MTSIAEVEPCFVQALQCFVSIQKPDYPHTKFEKK